MNNECTPEDNEKETIKEMIDLLTKILEGKQIRIVGREHTLNSIVTSNARWYSRQKFEVIEPKLRPLTLEELKPLVNQQVTDSTGFPYKVLGIEVQYKPRGEYIFVHIDSLDPLTPQELLESNLLYNGKPCGVEVAE